MCLGACQGCVSTVLTKKHEKQASTKGSPDAEFVIPCLSQKCRDV